MNTLFRPLVCAALVSAAGLVSLGANAADKQGRAALTEFYAHPEHCVGMVSVIEDQTEGQAAAFEQASTSAVKVLRQTSPSLTETEALMALRAGCAKALDVQAGKGGPGRDQEASLPRKRGAAASRE
jgi:hypothetical protein